VLYFLNTLRRHSLQDNARPGAMQRGVAVTSLLVIRSHCKDGATCHCGLAPRTLAPFSEDGPHVCVVFYHAAHPRGDCCSATSIQRIGGATADNRLDSAGRTRLCATLEHEPHRLRSSHLVRTLTVYRRTGHLLVICNCNG
jgi:hypothetical protein